MKKYFLISALAFSNIISKAQIQIPNPLPEFNGSYESPSPHHWHYPNTGEIRSAEEGLPLAENVTYYTQFTHPRQYNLSDVRISYVFAKADTSKSQTGQDSLHRIDMKFVNHVNTAFTIPADTQSFCKLNYMLSSIGTNIVDVHGSAALVTKGLWTNIHLVQTSNNAGLKHFYVVEPNGDPNNIELKFEGAKSTGINGTDLEIKANFDEFLLENPIAYQYNIINNVVSTFTISGCNWQPVGNDTYKINVGPYDNLLPLIILVRQGAQVAATGTNNIKWSTYVGGNSDDLIYKSKADANSNLFTCGATISSNFPQASGVSNAAQGQNLGNWDGFVTKFDQTGKLLWTTYIGGAKKEKLLSFDLEPTTGNIYCVGITTSSTGITATKNGAFNKSNFEGPLNSAQGDLDDSFIFELSANGQNKNWLTYYGGNGEDILKDCKFDANGGFFVVGGSQSTNIPVAAANWQYGQSYNTAQMSQVSGGGGVSDAIIAKFNATTNNIGWATYFGSDSNAGTTQISDDDFYSIEIASGNGVVYVAGRSGGINLPGKINNYTPSPNTTNGIVAAFTNYGALSRSRYTQGNEKNNVVKIDPNIGVIYLGGTGYSSMQPVNSGQYYYDGTCAAGDNDATFMVLSGDLTQVHHATFIGGKSYDAILDMQVDPYGIIYISGGTLSSDFPTVNYGGNTYFSTFNGANNYRTDYFLLVVKEFFTNLIWSTCLGTTSEETEFGGAASVLALDGNSKLHLCGLSASSNTFPVDNGGGAPVYFQATKSGGYDDATITRFDMLALQSVVGIKERKLESNIGLYPNPTKDYLMINEILLNNNSFSYTVINTLGQSVLQGNLSGQDLKVINVASLKDGIYIINFTSANKNYSSKFIKSND